MINFFVQMKLNKFANLYSKPLGDHTLKIMKNNIWKFTLKTWKYHGILSVRKSGNPEYVYLHVHVRIIKNFKLLCFILFQTEVCGPESGS